MIKFFTDYRKFINLNFSAIANLCFIWNKFILQNEPWWWCSLKNLSSALCRQFRNNNFCPICNNDIFYPRFYFCNMRLSPLYCLCRVVNFSVCALRPLEWYGFYRYEQANLPLHLPNLQALAEFYACWIHSFFLILHHENNPRKPDNHHTHDEN